jgi:hypothetical protein
MGVPSMPTTARTPPTPNTTSCSHDIHGSNNPSPATAPAVSTSVPISSPNHATRVGRSRDDRNHRLTRNSQRLSSAQAPIAISAWTSHSITPSTSSGPHTTSKAID